MNITIICVGKIREKYFSLALDEYKKRLSRYCTLNIVEVADEATPDNASLAMMNIIKEKEMERIIKYVKKNSYVITLEILGQMQTSEQLAKKIANLGVIGKSNITFIIGGSLGLHDEVSNMADYKLSFSKMTFPHQMMRVILLEQIYRAYRINTNEPYHK